MKRKRGKARPKVQHYLLTVELLGAPFRLHGYVMTTQPWLLPRVAEEMIDFAEREGLPVLGIILQTTLADKEDGPPDAASVALVRKLIVEGCPEAREALATATDFHRTIWLMGKDHPADGSLMALH